MRKIFLSQGKISLVDDEDYESLSKYKWYYNNIGYAVRDIWDKVIKKKKSIYLARSLMGDILPNQIIDHINQNKLDNRKNNLRITTRTVNLLNSGNFKHNTSGFRGVTWNGQKGKWQAAIQLNYKKRHLGFFSTKEEAGKTYQTFVRNLL